MNKIFRYSLQAIGLVAVVLFCVSAAASIGETYSMANRPFSEPINLMLLGVGLIGFGSFIRSKPMD